jgi:serine/threonine-protein kinase
MRTREVFESGRPEIWLRPFPNINAGRYLVSTAGGTRPVWTRSGRELLGRTYDVSPDGKRFLMIKNVSKAENAAPRDQISVVDNRFEELRRRVPVK